MDIGHGRAALRERTPEPLRRFAWRAMSAAKRQEPGLLMRYAMRVPPAEIAVPAGFEVRAWRPGDDPDWAELLDATGAFGAWNLSRLAAETKGLVRDGQFFVTHEETIVAATGLLERPLKGKSALEVAWVARHPDHAGLQLGEATTICAVRMAMALRGTRTIYLYTDDFRLTAIAMYLRLGFVPDLTMHRSYARRWQSVFAALAQRGSVEQRQAALDGGEKLPAPPAGD